MKINLDTIEELKWSEEILFSLEWEEKPQLESFSIYVDETKETFYYNIDYRGKWYIVTGSVHEN